MAAEGSGKKTMGYESKKALIKAVAETKLLMLNIMLIVR